MIATLLELALKSLLVAGATLVLLRLTRARSASERSFIAHVGLVAMVALPFASLYLPAMRLEAPAFLSPSVAKVAVQAPSVTVPLTTDIASLPASTAPLPEAATSGFTIPADVAPWLYAAPAIALLLLTLVALLRLVALRSRADILVEPQWLSALAHAQRRMNFKNGTALLVSDELASPISWGLVRPVILLNKDALSATREAEAIIAHELAHVARLDWAKLMLARVATAVFWFNPLAWVLAREAHQLREEAADDAVLAANVDGADYAQLLVGVARHECKGLLLGAHGVAPGKGSLRRRVTRVLDGTLPRGPAAKGWVTGFAAGMLVMAAPLAAVTFRAAPDDKMSDREVKLAERSPLAPTAPLSPQAAVAPAAPTAPTAPIAPLSPLVSVGPDGILVRSMDGEQIAHIAANAAAAAQRKAERGASNAMDEAIEMRALGLTPEYARSIRMAAPPQMGQIDHDEIVEMRAVGVTPEYLREIASSGFPKLTVDDVVQARALGMSGAYIRQMRSVGVKGDLDNLAELRAVGVTPEFVARAKRAGVNPNDTDRLTSLQVLGIDPGHPSPTRRDIDE